MRLKTVLPLAAAAAALALPATASAEFVHTVAAGESLTSVAAADGLTVAQLAAANGLSANAQLVAGSPLVIPPQLTGVAGPTSATGTVLASSSASGEGDADSDDPASTAPATGLVAAAGSGVGSGGSYVVQPGDTLSAIAARAGTTVSELAALNGLDPNAFLLYGTALRLPGAGAITASSTSVSYSSSSTATTQPVGAAAQGNPSAAPYPTPETVSPAQVAQIAAANGVPPSLADAIAYQESGFNNDLVSSADARGVMQILPGTWDWIGKTLAGPMPLAPASALDNVRGGVLLLHSLLSATGGNAAEAAAGYYQGLPSVTQNGEYPDTQQYVNDVLALQGKFGGG